MMMLPLLEQRGAVPMAAGTCSPSFLGRAGRALVCCDLIDKLDMLRIPAAWEDRDMNVIVTCHTASRSRRWKVPAANSELPATITESLFTNSLRSANPWLR